MRVLFITDTWKPQVNGIVTSIENTIPLLEKAGHTVSIIHPKQFFNISVFFYPEIKAVILPRRKLRELFEKYSPDAVHIMTEGPLGWAGRSLCIKKGIKFTTTYHTHLPFYVSARIGEIWVGPFYFLMKKFHQKAVRTLVATKNLYDELKARGFSNLEICPLGVDTDLFIKNEFPSVEPLPKPVFVYMGRIAAEKNLEEFLETKLPGTKLIIGDGPSRENLEKKYGREAKFVGYKFGKELVDWLSVSDVFVTPSYTETFGLTMLEALACSLPVAAHPTPATSFIITNGKEGYLSESLKEAAIKCLTIDRSNCRKKALNFSWEESAKIFISKLIPVRSSREKSF